MTKCTNGIKVATSEVSSNNNASPDRICVGSSLVLRALKHWTFGNTNL